MITSCILKSGILVNATNIITLDTPLHLAVSNNHIKTVEVLLNHQADVNAFSKCNSMPIHTAAHNNNRDILEILLANKADINALDENGNTALAIVTLKGHTDTIDYLIDRGGKMIIGGIQIEAPELNDTNVKEQPDSDNHFIIGKEGKGSGIVREVDDQEQQDLERLRLKVEMKKLQLEEMRIKADLEK